MSDVAAQFLPVEPAVNVRQHSPFLRDTGSLFWDRDEFDPISFDRPEPVNRVDEDEQIDSPMRRIGSEHVAPATCGACSGGWSARGSRTTLTRRRSSRAALDLDRYRLVILDQHPEYWSRQMHQRLKTWVFERGGTLMYLGGDVLDCEVEFIHDDTAAIHRNGDRKYWGDIRDFPGGPGSFRPGQMEITNECPAHLTRIRTKLTGMGAAAPFKVHAADHWAFEGTGLREGDLFGHATLDMRNRAAPRATRPTSVEHSPAGTLLLARASTSTRAARTSSHSRRRAVARSSRRARSADLRVAGRRPGQPRDGERHPAVHGSQREGCGRTGGGSRSDGGDRTGGQSTATTGATETTAPEAEPSPVAAGTDRPWATASGSVIGWTTAEPAPVDDVEPAMGHEPPTPAETPAADKSAASVEPVADAPAAGEAQAIEEPPANQLPPRPANP